MNFVFLIKDKRRDEDYDEDVEETLLDEVTFLNSFWVDYRVLGCWKYLLNYSVRKIMMPDE